MRESKYYKVIDDFISKAFHKDSFDTICTLLRVGGMSTSNWDPFIESRRAFNDYFSIMEKFNDNNELTLRLGLVCYCQSVEMSAPHEIIMNLTRILEGSRYRINPLNHLGRSKKKDSFYYVPPSAKVKYRHICEKLTSIGETEIVDVIEHIYSDSIRNSFTHSDYIIENGEYRYNDGKFATHISSDELTVLINDCIEFTMTFMHLHKVWLMRFANIKKYHKWSNYEVLELVCDDNCLHGFNVHFSNGSMASYKRTEDEVVATNIRFEQDGTLNFFCGSIDDLEPIWKVNGWPVIDWEELG